MTTENSSQNLPPPVPPTVIPSIVDTLEPELAAAYRSGNPAVMAAVAAGATTTQMVVNDIIRQGGAMNGLPPGVQLLVDERRKEMDLKAAEENAAIGKAAAAAIGMGFMATNIAQGAEYSGEGGRAGYEASVMNNYAEKSNTGDYWRNDFVELMRKDPAMADKVLATEEKKATDQKDQMTEFLSLDAAAARMQKFLLANQDNKDLFTHLNTPEADLLCSKSGYEWLEKNTDKYYEYQLLMSDLKQAKFLEDLKAEGYKGDASKHPAITLMEKREQLIREMRDEKDPDKKAALAQEYGNFRDQNKQFFDLVEKGELGTAAKLAAEMDKSGQKLVAEAAAKGGAPEIAQVEVARRSSNDEQAKADTSVAKADAKILTKADGYDDEPAAAPKVASTAPAPPTTTAEPQRLSIDARPLASSGMLQEPGVEATVAANDPQGPKTAPKVANGSPGMGGAG